MAQSRVPSPIYLKLIKRERERERNILDDIKLYMPNDEHDDAGEETRSTAWFRDSKMWKEE